MRKTFELTHPRHKPAQALDRVKHQLHKYIRRERGKELPEGQDYWDFDCRVGHDEASAAPAHIKELSSRLDAVAATGATTAYVEILARAAQRARPQTDEAPPESP